MSGARLSVRVRAGAPRNELAGIRHGVLVALVTAPAHEGRANRALVGLLARRLGIAPSRVAIVRGLHSRDKIVEVDGLDQETLDAMLGAE